MTEDGTIIIDKNLVAYIGVPESYIKEESERQKHEIERRLKMYRQNEPYPNLKGKEVIIVDDGIATGSTMKAALASVKNRGAKTVTVAVPVGPPSTIRELEKQADRVVCLYMPEYFAAIGQFYRDFEPNQRRRSNRTSQTKQATKPREPNRNGDGMIQQEIKIPVGKVVVEGNLNIPSGAVGIVLFAHGSGSSRFSSRNQIRCKRI